MIKGEEAHQASSETFYILFILLMGWRDLQRIKGRFFIKIQNFNFSQTEQIKKKNTKRTSISNKTLNARFGGQNYNVFEDLSLDSSDIHSPDCAPIQGTVWPCNIVQNKNNVQNFN